MVFVDAPVSGSEGPARAGQLTILASGPNQVRDVLAPVFGVLGRATAWLGPAGHGTRAKLVLNNWLADLTETTAETLSFARRLGLDPAEIVDLLESTPLAAPYAVQKARSMLVGDFSPAFALRNALKDAVVHVAGLLTPAAPSMRQPLAMLTKSWEPNGEPTEPDTGRRRTTSGNN